MADQRPDQTYVFLVRRDSRPHRDDPVYGIYADVWNAIGAVIRELGDDYVAGTIDSDDHMAGVVFRAEAQSERTTWTVERYEVG